MIRPMFKHRKTCRMCGSLRVKPFLDLGSQPPANSFIKPEQFTKENYYPLVVYFCCDCNLVQLLDVVNKKELFSNYVYLTSVMPTTPKHFTEYAKNVIDRFNLKKKGEVVIEIGSNDGLLLKAFQEKRINVLGVDPAKNIAKVANKNGIPTLANFWSESLAKKIQKKYGKAKVIIGNNVVAHIDNHHDLAEGVHTLLADDGVFIFEAPYLVDMFENLTFDTVYHEHLSFLSLRPLIQFFKQFDLQVFDVEFFNVQGHSFRLFVSKTNVYPISARLKKAVKKELDMELNKFQSYVRLAKNIKNQKNKLVAILKDLKLKGKSIAGYGAPAKGNTLLNYCNINHKILDYLTEALPTKIGLWSPGMHIPVINIKDAHKSPPDYFLMLAWNYKEKILEKEEVFGNKGGKFIIPTKDINII